MFQTSFCFYHNTANMAGTTRYSRKRSYNSYRRGGRRRPYRSYTYRRSTVPRQRVYGRGDYKTWWNGVKQRWFRPYTGKLGAVGGAIGAAAGNVIAPGIGGTVGAGLGTLGGMAVDRIMGWGDYTIKKNVLLMPNQSASVPVFGTGCIRVKHKEYIGTVICKDAGEFAIQSFPLNPGIKDTFPWLSAIASNFEQYVWNGMIFQFVSTSASALNSTNTALGKVIMATDYNASDDVFVAPQQMMGTEFSNMAKPAESFMHAIECAPNEQATKLYWVRTGPLGANQDLKLYDHGLFQIATQGMQAASIVGDLWVSYDVTFCKPVQNNVLGYSLPVAHYRLLTPSAANPFGVTYAPATDGNIPATNGSNLDCEVLPGVIKFPVNDDIGTYFISYMIDGDNTATVATGTIGATNCNLKAMFMNGIFGGFDNGGSVDNHLIHNFCIQVDGRDAQITYVTPTLPTGNLKGDLFIMQIPHDML